MVLDNIDNEIASKASSEKKNLRQKTEMNNLMVAKRECEARRLFLTGQTSHLAADSTRLLPFSFILDNSTALAYFLEVFPTA